MNLARIMTTTLDLLRAGQHLFPLLKFPLELYLFLTHIHVI